MKKRIALSLSAIALVSALTALAALAGSRADVPLADADHTAPQMANLADPESRAAAECALSRALGGQAVRPFLAWVDTYNSAMPAKLLRRGFAPGTTMPYDTYRLGEAWQAAQENAPGTNCRLNSYLLLKEAIGIRPGPIDDGLLFIDKDAIATAHLLGPADEARFLQLFSRVPTVATRDIRVHAAKMAAHFERVTFSERARLVSVVMHDAIDGDVLFIGHCGVLVPEGAGWLFVEKLAFDKPYQVIRFARIEDCYRYLYRTYETYADETTAPPFVMDNASLIDPQRLRPVDRAALPAS